MLFVLSFVAHVAAAQVAPGALVDLNTADEAALQTLPNVTPALAKTLVEKRPLAGPVAAQTVLKEGGLDDAKIKTLFGKAFVHIDLNTATSAEIQLIPGAGKKMAHEFDEYRPWKTFTQFDKEIGKYVGKDEVARLKQYCFIPLRANEASDDNLKTIPALDQKGIDAIKAGRPYKDATQLKGTLVKALGDKDGARVARYLVP